MTVWCSAVGVLVTLILGMLAAPLAAQAQPARKIPRIGVLSPASPPHPSIDAFRQGLRDLGYVEGQTVLLEYRYAAWQLDRLPALAAELVQLTPDVIFTYTTNGALAAKQATTTIPIVVGSAGDMVARGIVESLARPGGNITGTTTFGADLEGKRLELLKEVVPQMTRVAFLGNPASPAWPAHFDSLTADAQALGVQLLRVDARALSEFEGAFAAMAAGRADALLVTDNALFHEYRQRLAELAATHRLPAISRIRGFAEAGGLIQYGDDPIELARVAATHVDKILKGAKPGELPVERPMKFELVLNLKTAKALGLTMPPTLLLQADEVIQ
jgi:putative tryptophan/tyrosine transport system substrate-binding protein